MTATYEQASFPYTGLLGLILAVGILLFVIISMIRLHRSEQAGENPPKRNFQRIWSAAVTLLAILLIFVSTNSLSVGYRLQNAWKTGQYETWTGTIAEIEVEDKGTDFLSQPSYKIVLTIDTSETMRQFTCSWLNAEQILLLQKGTTVTIGCASQIGTVTVKEGRTIYQSPDANGNVVWLEVPEN